MRRRRGEYLHAMREARARLDATLLCLSFVRAGRKMPRAAAATCSSSADGRRELLALLRAIPQDAPMRPPTICEIPARMPEPDDVPGALRFMDALRCVTDMQPHERESRGCHAVRAMLLARVVATK